MRISRRFIDQTMIPGSTIDLPVDISHYFHTVLRLKEGANVLLFNGQGGEYVAVLESTGRLKQARILEHRAQEVESPLKVHLIQALAKGDKLDWVMQKATELGVAAITPVMTARCDVRLAPDRVHRKLEHWKQIVISACEQCGRNRVPPVHAPVSLIEWIQLSDATQATGIVLTPDQPNLTLRKLDPPTDWIILVVGPEGGLTDSELDPLHTAGFRSITLGPRILRTETAACAALATMQTLWGDFA